MTVKEFMDTDKAIREDICNWVQSNKCSFLGNFKNYKYFYTSIKNDSIEEYFEIHNNDIFYLNDYGRIIRIKSGVLEPVDSTVLHLPITEEDAKFFYTENWDLFINNRRFLNLINKL